MQRRSSQALDGIASFLGRLVIRSGAAAENTLAQLDAYRGRTVEELFPAPPGLPDVTVARAWKVGPFERPDRIQVPLTIQLQASIIDLPIEMNGQLRNPQ